MEGRMLDVEVGSYTWKLDIERKKRTLFLMGIADTNISNIMALRCLALTLHWPPVRWLNCVTNRGDNGLRGATHVES